MTEQLLQCPDCGIEIEIAQFGVSHIAGVGCIKCGENMESVEIDELNHLSEKVQQSE